MTNLYCFAVCKPPLRRGWRPSMEVWECACVCVCKRGKESELDLLPQKVDRKIISVFFCLFYFSKKANSSRCTATQKPNWVPLSSNPYIYNFSLYSHHIQYFVLIVLRIITGTRCSILRRINRSTSHSILLTFPSFAWHFLSGTWSAR